MSAVLHDDLPDAPPAAWDPLGGRPVAPDVLAAAAPAGAPRGDVLLTPVAGGHVFAGTWEHLAALTAARCAACDFPVKINGILQWSDPGGVRAMDADALCAGWRADAPAGQLVRVVRGLTRDADGGANGPTEETMQAMLDAHVAIIGPHDDDRMIVSVAKSKEAGDRMHAHVEAQADDCRALRLALAHDERRTPAATEEEGRPTERLSRPKRVPFYWVVRFHMGLADVRQYLAEPLHKKSKDVWTTPFQKLAVKFFSRREAREQAKLWREYPARAVRVRTRDVRATARAIDAIAALDASDALGLRVAPVDVRTPAATEGLPEHTGDDACPACTAVLDSPSVCAISHDFRPGAYGPPPAEMAVTTGEVPTLDAKAGAK